MSSQQGGQAAVSGDHDISSICNDTSPLLTTVTTTQQQPVWSPQPIYSIVFMSRYSAHIHQHFIDGAKLQSNVSGPRILDTWSIKI